MPGESMDMKRSPCMVNSWPLNHLLLLFERHFKSNWPLVKWCVHAVCATNVFQGALSIASVLKILKYRRSKKRNEFYSDIKQESWSDMILNKKADLTITLQSLQEIPCWNLSMVENCQIYSPIKDLRWPTTVTAKYNSPRQNKIGHGKIQFITAKYISKQQIQITHGKLQTLTAKTKTIIAIQNSSRQEQNAHGKSKTTGSTHSCWIGRE